MTKTADNSGGTTFRHIRLDASTACQLKCPGCPTASGEVGKSIGTGFLKFEDFKKLVDDNPFLSRIELSNWGEIFLNKDLVEILAYAYKRDVALTVYNGANLNHVTDEVLEALVKYRLRVLSCSLDGASQETYSQYRMNGNFDTVIENIKKINRYKSRYRSPFPVLEWQFVAFGHNEHEIAKARRMAADLDMQFDFKLSWDDLYGRPFSPVRDKDLVRRESGLGVATREEYRQMYGGEFVERRCCAEIFQRPQINFDGRVLGCSINYWGDFGNVFQDGLQKVLNNEAINYARKMLKGQVPARDGIPCSTCKVYARMKEEGSWVTDKETEQPYIRGRRYVMLENKVLGVKGTMVVAEALVKVRHPVRTARELGGRWSRLWRLRTGKGTIGSGVSALKIPLEPDPEKGWKPYSLVRGNTAFTDYFSFHCSVLKPGHCPHPPHQHQDEEILIMLAGEAELLLPGEEAEEGRQKVMLRAGQFVYYPTGFAHTLVPRGEVPANYLMFKWYGRRRSTPEEDILGHGRYDLGELFASIFSEKGFRTRRVFEGPTRYLKKLHCHVSVLMPGAGYAPHADQYDVALVVLEGCVETLGQWVEPYGVVFYKAGEPHGIHNPGNEPARYLVFEFHG